MENDDWYFFDYKKKKYVLTDKAPKKAVESYEEFYSELRGDVYGIKSKSKQSYK